MFIEYIYRTYLKCLSTCEASAARLRARPAPRLHILSTTGPLYMVLILLWSHYPIGDLGVDLEGFGAVHAWQKTEAYVGWAGQEALAGAEKGAVAVVGGEFADQGAVTELLADLGWLLAEKRKRII